MSEDSSLCIVVVKIHHNSNLEKIVETLAFLDNGSQGTLVCDDILHKLGVPSVETSLEIQTVTGRATVKSLIVTGLCVRSVEGEPMASIMLPKAYTRKTFPYDISDVPTVNSLKKWNYLKDLVEKLPDVSKYESIGILIGTNIPKVLEPLEIIHNREEGQFAHRTRLGWCVTGQMDFVRKTKISCNRIRITGNNTTNHFFRVKEAIKDVSLKEMIIKSQSLDFHEASQGALCSLEDKKFLNIMEEGFLKDNHYHLPLPLRDKEKLIPNNRHQSIQRAMWLKQRLLKMIRCTRITKVSWTPSSRKGMPKMLLKILQFIKPGIFHTMWYIIHISQTRFELFSTVQ